MKNIFSGAVLCGMALVSLSACGRATTATSNGGCTTDATPGMCLDYPGSSYTAASVQAACESSTGTYIAAGCTTADRVGSCTAGATATQVIYRYYGTYTGGAAAGELACGAVSGTWAAN